jgi:hypothetical protein
MFHHAFNWHSKRNSKFVDGKLKSSPTKIPAFESLEEPKIEEDLSNKKTFRQVLDSFFSAKRRKQNIQAFMNQIKNKEI